LEVRCRAARGELSEGGGRALLDLNRWIKTEMAYAPGSTRIDTPVATSA
jgi:hypothetical protein